MAGAAGRLSWPKPTWQDNEGVVALPPGTRPQITACIRHSPYLGYTKLVVKQCGETSGSGEVAMAN